MLYIVTALKPEAQAFVDKYKLNKTKYENITIFTGEGIRVIVSGLGAINTNIAITAIIKNFKPSKDDIFLNIGICGASREYRIGELIEIGSIIYKEQMLILNSALNITITCKDSEVNNNSYHIVDMESFGFYEATNNINKRYIFKVVSDHFEPSTVTKDKTKKLIFNVIDDVMKRIEE